MMTGKTLILAGIAFWITFFPVYLWGYLVSCLLDTPWNKRRFLLGMLIGAISVVFSYSVSYLSGHFHILIGIMASLGILSFSGVIWLIIRMGSRLARGIISRIFSLHILIILGFFGVFSLLFSVLPNVSYLMLVLFPLFFSSLIEETYKHLMSIGLMSQDFRFSRTDLILFTIFVVLGFVFSENILYLIFGDFSLGTWIWRSFFSLVAHVTAALLCVYGWWTALSYEPYSGKYIVRFLLGFFLAVGSHMFYNLLLEQGSIVALFIYTACAYVFFTQGIINKDHL